MLRTRQEVYEAVDGERAYQDQKWGQDHDQGHDVPAWLCFMQHHLTRAIEATTKSVDQKTALAQVRKITALGVSCMESCGIVTREEEDR